MAIQSKPVVAQTKKKKISSLWEVVDPLFSQTKCWLWECIKLKWPCRKHPAVGKCLSQLQYLLFVFEALTTAVYDIKNKTENGHFQTLPDRDWYRLHTSLKATCIFKNHQVHNETVTVRQQNGGFSNLQPLHGNQTSLANVFWPPCWICGSKNPAFLPTISHPWMFSPLLAFFFFFANCILQLHKRVACCRQAGMRKTNPRAVVGENKVFEKCNFKKKQRKTPFLKRLLHESSALNYGRWERQRKWGNPEAHVALLLFSFYY